MDEIGGDLITFGIVDNNPIFAVTGKAAHEYVKLLKRRNVDLRTSLIGIKNIIRIEDIMRDWIEAGLFMESRNG